MKFGFDRFGKKKRYIEFLIQLKKDTWKNSSNVSNITATKGI
jgi:hypothetical protein